MKPAYVTKVAEIARICYGEDGVNEFLAMTAGKFEEIMAMSTCAAPPFMVPKKGPSSVATPREVVDANGRRQMVVQQEGVPVFLVSLIGTVRVPLERAPAPVVAPREDAPGSPGGGS